MEQLSAWSVAAANVLSHNQPVKPTPESAAALRGYPGGRRGLPAAFGIYMEHPMTARLAGQA